MSFKTLTTTLLLSTSFLLFTACETKTTQEEQTNNIGVQNPTTQTTDDSSTSGEDISDGSTTTTDGTTGTDGDTNDDSTSGGNNGGVTTTTTTGTGNDSDDDTSTSTDNENDDNTVTGGETTTNGDGGETDTNTSTGGGNDDTTTSGTDDNVTTGGNDDNATTSGNDKNTTTTPTVTLSSLNLTIHKTSLNKDDTTPIKVMATYSDNTSKELTDNVEWIVTPSDSVKVTNATLTALKDKATTVKAKVGTTLSNTLNLTIAWEVNGHVLPPEPDKTLNDSTLLGIDVNNNGVRDDVERWIYDRYKDSHEIMIPLRMQTSRAYQKIIVDPSKAYETHKYMVDALNCETVFTSYANYFGRKPLVLIESEDGIQNDKDMEYIQYNTTQRARAYGNYNQTLSGGVFRGEWPDDKWVEDCDFNTTKYIEMSEKL